MTGQVATTSPEEAKVGYQASYSNGERTARMAARPRGAARRHDKGRCSSTQAATTLRIVSELEVRSRFRERSAAVGTCI